MIDPINPVTTRATILVVDDTPANIEVMHAMLAPDYEVLFATNGHEALELAAKTRPDLILLDIIMPEMNGHEVCQRLKSDVVTKDIPIVFVTAMAATDSEEKGLRLGAIDYIVKPFSPAVVKARIANHLELKRYRDLLADLVWIDGLTGARNRRYFDECLPREFRRAMRAHLPLSLMMIDVDYFKQYNDQYGHLAGDDCLKAIVNTLTQLLRRPADVVFRYGGEEFVCLLPDTDANGAAMMAEQVLNRCRKLAVEHKLSPYGIVTLSIGLTTLMPQPEQHVSDLVEIADQALYRAKEEGRNRLYVL
ncbi:diguanylate cyclase domain-containing protein [Agitococcus lubricus]|uniref:diguanylate cyclase n=1 Tax=Agitococcus lubricus TaxID=1077255 RepID=A0A2T5J3N0_9GAMM|nr:diguanylate cyclase [Agitococcus lubricus]PTQ91113.1 response regulator receiver modulated diguanylate cyclase [Agitococcus lubricus]